MFVCLKQFDSAHHPNNNNNLPASIIGLNRHPSTANKHSLGNNFIGKNIPPPSLPSEILTTPTTPTANNQFFTAVNDDEIVDNDLYLYNQPQQQHVQLINQNDPQFYYDGNNYYCSNRQYPLTLLSPSSSTSLSSTISSSSSSMNHNHHPTIVPNVHDPRAYNHNNNNLRFSSVSFDSGHGSSSNAEITTFINKSVQQPQSSSSTLNQNRVSIQSYESTGSNTSSIDPLQHKQQQQKSSSISSSSSSSSSKSSSSFCSSSSLSTSTTATNSSSSPSQSQIDSFTAANNVFLNMKPPSSSQQQQQSSSSSFGNVQNMKNEKERLLAKAGPLTIAEMLLHGVADSEMIHVWLQKIQLSQYEQNFLDACYDMSTISRMTPQDLIAIGITDPKARSLFTNEIQKLKVPENLPDYRPSSLYEWLKLLNMDCYHQGLCQQGYTTIDHVLQLTWEDLEDVGINKLGHQKKILLAIKKTKSIKSSSIDMNDSIGNSHRPTSNGNDFNQMLPPPMPIPPPPQSPSHGILPLSIPSSPSSIQSIYDQTLHHHTKLPYNKPVTIDTFALANGQTTTTTVPNNNNAESQQQQQPYQDVMIKMYANNNHTPRSMMTSPINNNNDNSMMMTNRPIMMMENCHIIDKRTNPMAPMIMSAMDSKSQQRMHTFQQQQQQHPYLQQQTQQPNLMRNNSMIQNNHHQNDNNLLINQSNRRRSLESLNIISSNEYNNNNDNGGSPVIYANMSNIILNSSVPQQQQQRLLSSPYQYSNNNCDPATTMMMMMNRQTIFFPESPRPSTSISTFSNLDHLDPNMIEQQQPISTQGTNSLNRPLKILSMLTNQTGQTKSLQDSNMIEMSAMNNHRQQSPRINISNSDIYSTFNQQQQVRKKPPPPPPPPRRSFNSIIEQQPLQSNSMPTTPIHQRSQSNHQNNYNDNGGDDDVLFVKQLNLATPNTATLRNENFFANCVKTMTNNFADSHFRRDDDNGDNDDHQSTTTTNKSGLRIQNNSFFINKNRTLPLPNHHHHGQQQQQQNNNNNMITNSSSSSAESMYFANDNIGTIKHNMPAPSFGHSSSTSSSSSSSPSSSLSPSTTTTTSSSCSDKVLSSSSSTSMNINNNKQVTGIESESLNKRDSSQKIDDSLEHIEMMLATLKMQLDSID
uniref:GATA zinc finger domain-containing protein 7-like n=1 Tax=Dermatophagoides pteronyssinus TaxID=6956 RepID=A0A6P6Y2N3_DERPT|nr:GATA zinc finger domain-containing protein 7-like [Dermatophagoides pteronyssinus]